MGTGVNNWGQNSAGSEKQMVRVRECLHDAQELKRRVQNQYLFVSFHDGAIGAYGPRTARLKVGYVSFTRNKLSEPFYFFPNPFHFFLSCKWALRDNSHFLYGDDFFGAYCQPRSSALILYNTKINRFVYIWC